MKRNLFLLLASFFAAVSASQANAQTFWQESNGVPLGKIEIFFSAGDSVILASSAAGVFRSVDGARTWKRTDLDQLAWFLIADAAGQLYAGTSTRGIFRSGNAGINWTPLNSGLTTLEIHGLTACPNGNIVAITASGIFRLSPQDTSWSLLNETMWKYDLMVIACNSKNTLFAGAPRGTTYRSTDGGVSWVKLDLINPNYFMRTVFIDKRDYIFRSLYDVGIQRSTNNGDTWSTLSIIDVASIDTDSTGTMFGGSSYGVIHSSDGGETWRITSGPYALAVAALDNGMVLASGLNGEIWRSLDHGESFAPVATTPNGSVTALAAQNRGLIFAGSFAAGVFRSADNGASWTETDDGVTNRAINSLLVAPHGEVFVATQSGVFKSVDSGESWTKSDSGMTSKWTNDLCSDSSGRLFAATNGGGMFVSSDTGGSWLPVGGGVIAPTIRKVVCGPNGAMYAGCYPGGVYRSSDTGVQWQFLSNAFSQGESVETLAVDSSGHIAAATGLTLKCSDDNGISWTTVSYAFPNRLWTVFLDRAGHIYQSTEGGKVYRSDDLGATWTDFSSGLPVNGQAISSFAIGDDGYLFAGTGNGVYRSVESILSSVQGFDNLVREFNLAPNYPNPFNPTTTITYSVPHRSYVFLAVFNILGQKLADLVDGEINAGVHEIRFDARSLASGVYFCRMQAHPVDAAIGRDSGSGAGDFVQTRKLLLMK